MEVAEFERAPREFAPRVQKTLANLGSRAELVAGVESVAHLLRETIDLTEGYTNHATFCRSRRMSGDGLSSGFSAFFLYVMKLEEIVAEASKLSEEEQASLASQTSPQSEDTDLLGFGRRSWSMRTHWAARVGQFGRQLKSSLPAVAISFRVRA